MPHATEGELHAHIDGALSAIDPIASRRLATHLETCGDCRRRLEEARSVRDESAALLEVALGGAVEPPPFETVARKAGGRADAPRGVGPRRRPGAEGLAWAASITVALGAGWMARAVIRDPLPPPVESAAVVIDKVEALRDADAAPESVVAPSAEAEGEAEAAGAENETRARRVAGDAPADRESPPAAAPDFFPDVSPATDGSLASDVSPATDAPATDRRLAEGEVETAEALSRTSAVGKAAASELDALLDDELLEDVVWITVAREVAEAEQGGPMVAVPELETLDYAIALPEGTGRTRLRQRLPGGEILELMAVGSARIRQNRQDRPRESTNAIQPSAGRRDLAGPARQRMETVEPSVALTRVWLEVNGMQVWVSAPIALDSLRALLLRIR